MAIFGIYSYLATLLLEIRLLLICIINSVAIHILKHRYFHPSDYFLRNKLRHRKMQPPGINIFEIL